MPLHLKEIAYEARHWPRVNGFNDRIEYSISAVVTLTYEGAFADISLCMSREQDKVKSVKQMAAFYRELSDELRGHGVELMTWRHKGALIERNLVTGKTHCEPKGGKCERKCEFCKPEK